MPHKRDMENAMKNLSYLVLLSRAKNSWFSTNEKQFPLFWPRKTPFPFRFSSSSYYLKRVRKWSRLSTCFSELIFTIRRSNEMSQHFEASFFRSENVLAPAVTRHFPCLLIENTTCAQHSSRLQCISAKDKPFADIEIMFVEVATTSETCSIERSKNG